MSLLGSIGNVFKSALPSIGAIGGSILGGSIGGPLGAGIGGTIGGSIGATNKSLPALPGGGGKLPPILGGVVTAAGGMARRVSSAARGAASMCSRYPQWCVAAGGVAAIASMMQSGQLPIPKRRRRRGITPKDLASFRRVAGLIKSYGPTARKVPSRCAPRKSCK